MSSSSPSTPNDLLMPNGLPIGTRGKRPSIRLMPGGIKAADHLFDDLAVDGTPVELPTYPGRMVDVPGCGRLGLRPSSKSGEPTIDVDIRGIPIQKIKFV
jgi:hypothetical protein